MIGAIQLDTLMALVSQHAVCEAVVGRMVHDNSKLTSFVCLGVPTSRLIPMRSRLEPSRTRASLTAVGRFAESVGLTRISVEL